MIDNTNIDEFIQFYKKIKLLENNGFSLIDQKYLFDMVEKFPEFFDDKRRYAYWQPIQNMIKEKEGENFLFLQSDVFLLSGYIVKYLYEVGGIEKIIEFSRMNDAFLIKSSFMGVPNKDIDIFIQSLLSEKNINVFLQCRENILKRLPADFIVDNYKIIDNDKKKNLSFIHDLPCEFIEKRKSIFNWGVISQNHDMTYEFATKFENKTDWSIVGYSNYFLLCRSFYGSKKELKEAGGAKAVIEKKLNEIGPFRTTYSRQKISNEVLEKIIYPRAKKIKNAADSSAVPSTKRYFLKRYNDSLKNIYSEIYMREIYDGSEEKGYFERFCEEHIYDFFYMETAFIKKLLNIYDFSNDFLERHLKEFAKIKCKSLVQGIMQDNVNSCNA